jgi:hypothetical protein
MRTVGIVFVFIALATLACAEWLNERQKTFYATALRAEGRVINLITRRGGRS